MADVIALAAYRQGQRRAVSSSIADPPDEENEPRRVARWCDIPADVLDYVNESLSDAGSLVTLEGTNVMMIDIIYDALLGVADELWEMVCVAVEEAHPELKIVE